MARDDPDFAIRDLYNAIAQGDYPSYTMYIQVMSFEVSLKKKEPKKGLTSFLNQFFPPF